MKIQCARLEGLDSKEGLLLLGTTHFYVIEGMTLNRTGDIADLENLAIEYETFCFLHISTHAYTYSYLPCRIRDKGHFVCQLS